jgi:hypothetical protein
MVTHKTARNFLMHPDDHCVAKLKVKPWSYLPRRAFSFPGMSEGRDVRLQDMSASNQSKTEAAEVYELLGSDKEKVTAWMAILRAHFRSKNVKHLLLEGLSPSLRLKVPRLMQRHLPLLIKWLRDHDPVIAALLSEKEVPPPETHEFAFLDTDEPEREPENPGGRLVFPGIHIFDFPERFETDHSW